MPAGLLTVSAMKPTFGAATNPGLSGSYKRGSDLGSQLGDLTARRLLSWRANWWFRPI